MTQAKIASSCRPPFALTRAPAVVTCSTLPTAVRPKHGVKKIERMTALTDRLSGIDADDRSFRCEVFGHRLFEMALLAKHLALGEFGHAALICPRPNGVVYFCSPVNVIDFEVFGGTAFTARPVFSQPFSAPGLYGVLVPCRLRGMLFFKIAGAHQATPRIPGTMLLISRILRMQVRRSGLAEA